MLVGRTEGPVPCRVFAIDADDLAAGTPADGFRTHRLLTRRETPAAPALRVRPVRLHTATPRRTVDNQPAAFFVNFHDGNTLVVWGLYT